MTYRLLIQTSFSRPVLEDRLLRITSAGPFLVRDLKPVEPGIWTFMVQPERPDMAIGFGKIAELLVLLARDFEVQALDRAPLRPIAAAS